MTKFEKLTEAVNNIKAMENKENKKFLVEYTVIIQVPIEAKNSDDAYDEAYDIDPFDYVGSTKNTDTQMDKVDEITEDEWTWWTK